MNIKEFVEEVKSKPLVIHINPIGLIRLGSSNEERFEGFNSFLTEVEGIGGNIAIPVYSYSYAKGEVFSISETPSDLDIVSEYVRKKNPQKRTSDGNFSYLLFGNGFSKNNFEVKQNYSSFGQDSLVHEVYTKSGYLGAIGGVLEYLTEIHYLERLLQVDYRFDKTFSGRTIDNEGDAHDNETVYYCRDLSSDYSVSFVRLKKDIIESGLVKKIKIDDPKLTIEIVDFVELHSFIQDKLDVDKKYLWEQS